MYMSSSLRTALTLIAESERSLTGWNAALQCLRMNSLISSSVTCKTAPQRVVPKSASGTRVRENGSPFGKDGVLEGGFKRTYSIGICIPHVEKVLCVGRVCLGFEYILDTICAADTHRKPHATYEDIHVVL
jgi:hypothetical protein